MYPEITIENDAKRTNLQCCLVHFSEAKWVVLGCKVIQIVLLCH